MSALPSQELSCSQNFLKDPALVAALLDRSSIRAGDLVVEIGPGQGIITEQLARACRQVLAIEKDPRLFTRLRRRLAAWPNVDLYQGDFLRFRLPEAPYKVFANIPFNHTSAIVSHLLSARFPPQDAFLAMQKEAAEGYCGAPNESLRTVLLKPWFEPQIVHHFRRADFAPAPRVDVVMLRLCRRERPLVTAAAQAGFRDFAVYTFTTWRPTLGGILKQLFSWPQLKRIRQEWGIDLDGTPTRLSFEQWLGLFACFEQFAGPRARQIVAGSQERLLHQQARLEKVHRTRRQKG